MPRKIGKSVIRRRPVPPLPHPSWGGEWPPAEARLLAPVDFWRRLGI